MYIYIYYILTYNSQNTEILETQKSDNVSKKYTLEFYEKLINFIKYLSARILINKINVKINQCFKKEKKKQFIFFY